MANAASGEEFSDWVVIREEAQDWVQELSMMLTEKGIESSIMLAPGCKSGTCGCKFQLLVAKDDVKNAVASIDEYYIILHPEIKESEEWAAEDKCPACGFDAGAEAKECPDCGLLLIIGEA